MGVTEDLVDKRFGMLTVQGCERREGRIYWLCVCDCGRSTAVVTSSLKRSMTTSCGCRSRIGLRNTPMDMTGQRFGRLVAVTMEKRAHGIYWRCRCDCGGEITADGKQLRRGHTKSCGCLGRENRTDGMREVGKAFHARYQQALARVAELEAQLAALQAERDGLAAVLAAYRAIVERVKNRGCEDPEYGGCMGGPCVGCAAKQLLAATPPPTPAPAGPDAPLPCQDCGRPVVEFTVPNAIFNRVMGTIGAGYICIWCFDRRAAAAGVTYEAEFSFVGAAGKSVLRVHDVEPPAGPDAPVVGLARAYFAALERWEAIQRDDERFRGRLTFPDGGSPAYADFPIATDGWWEEWHRRHDAHEEAREALDAALASASGSVAEARRETAVVDAAVAWAAARQAHDAEPFWRQGLALTDAERALRAAVAALAGETEGQG